MSRASRLRALADELAAEPDQDYKDEWERGFDAGQMAAGRELQKLLLSGEPTVADIDREALRIANSARYNENRVLFLDTLNPQAQDLYRSLARLNLGVTK